MRIVVVAAVIWAAVFSYLAVSRHDAFESNAFDLGYVTQTLWNTAHGRPFVFSTLDGVPFSPEGTLNVDLLRHPHSLLAFHVEPVLLLVAPIFALWPDPRFLLVLQSIALASGAIGIAGLAQRRLAIPTATVIFGLAFLLAPSIAAAAMSDFHAVAIAAALIPAALYFWSAGKNRLALALAILAALTREDSAILVASIGAYFYVRGVRVVPRTSVPAPRSTLESAPVSGDPFDILARPGLFLLLGAGLWAIIALGAIIPFFNGSLGALLRHQSALGSVFWHRYEWLGATPLEAARNVVVEPGRWIDWFSQRDVQSYVLTLLLTGGLIAVAAPDALAIAVPVVLLNTLSSFDWMRSGGAHYSVVLVPVLLFAGIEGTSRIAAIATRLAARKGSIWRQTGVALPFVSLAVILWGSAANHVWLGASPAVPGLAWPTAGPRHLLVDRVLAGLPAGASVAASSAVYPHVASRERAYWFPAVNDADYVAIDVASSTGPIGPRETRDRVDDLMSTGNYQLADTAPGFLLFKRTTTPVDSPPADFPDSFYDFARAPALANIVNLAASSTQTRFGDNLSLDGFHLDDVSSQTIFGPTAIVTTYWHVDAPVVDHLRFTFYVSRRSDGAMVGVLPDAAPEPVWYPPYLWKPGETIHLTVTLPRVDDLQAVGVAVVGDAGTRLPIHATPDRGTWENGTIVRIARLDR